MHLQNETLIINNTKTIDDEFLNCPSLPVLFSIIKEKIKIEISGSLKDRIQRSHNYLLNLFSDSETNERIYGVNTGFGQNAKMFLSFEDNKELQNNLIEYLDAATGEETNYILSKLTLLLRIINFARGYSGVSLEMVNRLTLFFNEDYTPIIPYEGSLGASGNLIPLARIGACLQGIGDCYTPFGEGRIESQEVLKILKLDKFTFKGKDALGLVNGTPLMAAIASENLFKCSHYLEKALDNISAIYEAQNYQLSFLSQDIHEVSKPHPGQVYVAQNLRKRANAMPRTGHKARGENGISREPMQSPYSIRCVPQILGALKDVLTFAETTVATEAFSVNDNPIISPVGGAVFSGGNFFGGHIAMSMDALKGQIVQFGSLIDRQILLLCDDRTNNGLPMNLSKKNTEGVFWDHGLKGLHQYATSLFCELSSSATVSAAHTRSTETHNQDIISLGTHSAKQVERLLKTLKKLMGIHTIITARVLELNGALKEGSDYCDICHDLDHKPVKKVLEEVEEKFA